MEIRKAKKIVEFGAMRFGNKNNMPARGFNISGMGMSNLNYVKKANFT